ncbi:MAG: efflux RND transporter permease subunit, partial [Gammaproteobacteria bacterium]|nr:efflux RND transporter permease subunit [Gammaproteobacteria bacterium]
MNIIETAIRRPVTVAMFTLATLVFGLVLLNRLGFNLLPELNYPTLTVRTEFEGAAPVEVENLISKPLEGVLGTIKGLRQVKSVSRAGQSDVYLEFYWGTNIDLASLDVREKLEQVELPLEVKSPSLLRFDPNNDPIIRMSLSQKSADKNTEQPANINNQATLSELRRYSDLQLTRRLETIEGVAAAKSSGGLKDEIQILIDQNKVAQFNLSLSDISQRLKTQNINMSGGQIINGQRQLLVRTFNEYQSIEDFSNTIILSESQKVVRLKDIADVKFSHKDPTAVIRHNGEQSVEIAIYKEGDANTVQVADAVKSRLDGLKKQLPENMQLTLLTDSSIFIKQSIDELVSAAVWGGLLAMLVIYLFLGSIRSTIIISATIPLSVIVTFNLMYTAKVDINIMSLGGLALAVGMLVDNAIVVLENIAKKREQGLSLAQSSYEGASEVSGAITASTLTTIAVFLPLIFVEGIAGQLFRDQALTITFSLLVSLAIALTVIPTMAAKRQIKSQDDIVLQRSEKPLWKRILLLPIELLVFFITAILEVINLIGLFFKFLLKLLQPLRSVFDNLFGRLETFYHRLLTASLQQQFKTISIAMAMLIASLLILGQRPQVVLPEMAQGQFIAKVKYTPGTSIEVTDKKVVELSRQLLAIEGVNEVFATAGSGNKLTANPEQEGNNQAEFSLLLDKSLSKNQEDQLLIQIRQVIAENTQGTNTEIDRPKLFSFSTPLSVELYGYDLDNLKKAAQRVSKSLAESPRFIDIQSNMQKGYPEAQITFDQEKMAYLGL